MPADDEELLVSLLGEEAVWAEPSDALEDTVVDAVVRAADADAPREDRRRRVIAIGAVAVALAAALAVFAIVALRGGSPTDFTATLAGTPLAHGAHATAAITRNGAGFRIVLDARGLPALPNGGYYQAWLKNGAGVLVPVGTFSSSDGKVTLWSGVSP